MEMHQVRYFLAVARLGNFTRAADDCHVTQPSLTRAIKQLEAELGGALLLRERPTAQLTELGQRMLPLLRQCYESAMGARQLASSFKSGEMGALRIAMSHSVDLSLIMPQLNEIKALFNRVEFRLMRGNKAEVARYLTTGEADLGVAVELPEDRDRLDVWPLFTESFQLVVNKRNALAKRCPIALTDLRAEQLLSRQYCEHADNLNATFRGAGVEIDRSHMMSSEYDLMVMLDADIGVAVVPRSATTSDAMHRSDIDGLHLQRSVRLFSVAGRERTSMTATAIQMLRSADWSRFSLH